MQILRRAGYRQMPWKNGQGLTEEVLTFPEGSAVDAFDWRISIAHVGADGPFSIFPGIDRTIALLDGAGLILDLPDQTEHPLSPGGKPFAFPGEWEISSRNVDGGTMDLNIMTRRGRYEHRVVRRVLEAGATVYATQLIIFVLMSVGSVQLASDELIFDWLDCLILQPGDTCLISSTPVEMLDIEVWPVE